MCVCVCPCFTSHIHHRALSPGLGKRTGESLEGLGCRLQRCTLTKHLFHKINASRLAWVPEKPRSPRLCCHSSDLNYQTDWVRASGDCMDTDWSCVLEPSDNPRVPSSWLKSTHQHPSIPHPPGHCAVHTVSLRKIIWSLIQAIHTRRGGCCFFLHFVLAHALKWLSVSEYALMD